MNLSKKLTFTPEEMVKNKVEELNYDLEAI
jgi:hypothetical protein